VIHRQHCRSRRHDRAAACREAKTEAPPAASAPAETGKTAGEATAPPQPAMMAQSDATADKASKPAPEKIPVVKAEAGTQGSCRKTRRQGDSSRGKP